MQGLRRRDHRRTQGQGSSIRKICTELLILGHIPCNLVAAGSMVHGHGVGGQGHAVSVCIAVGWGLHSINTICTEPRAQASWSGVGEASGELMGRAHR